MNNEHPPRFSDAKLARFYQQFLDHSSDEQKYREEEKKRWKETCLKLENLHNQVTDLRAEFNQHDSDSADLLEAWKASQGFLTVTKAIGRVMQWVGAITTAVGAMYGVYLYLFKNGSS